VFLPCLLLAALRLIHFQQQQKKKVSVSLLWLTSKNLIKIKLFGKFVLEQA
jgi:hypothetical protein